MKQRVRCVGVVLMVLGSAACGSSSSSNESGTGLSGSDLTRVNNGKAAVAARNCGSCHGPDLAGQATPVMGTMAFAVNLTPDSETGLGDWDEAMIAKAILTGVDDEDEQLCPTMPVFMSMGMTEAEANDIAFYLKTIAPVSKTLPESTCPPLKGGDEGAAGAGQ